MKWPWQRRGPSEKTVEIEERLQAVEADDVKITELERKIRTVIRENDLASSIMRALGAPQ